MFSLFIEPVRNEAVNRNVSQMTKPPPTKSLLRRRQSLNATLEAFLTGVAVVALAYGTATYFNGAFRLLDLFAVLTLLAAMTVTYDHIGVYRRHTGLVVKSIIITKAWFISLGIVLTCAYFLGILTDYYPPQEVMFFAASGLLIQLSIHLFFNRFPLFRPEKNKAAIIVGAGLLANRTYERINENQWIPETVHGLIAVPGDNKVEVDDNGAPILGTLDNIDSILETVGVNVVYVVTSLDASEVLRHLYFDLLDRSIDIHWIPDIFQLSLINPNVKEISGVPIITLSESPLAGEWSHLLKTLEDKFLASICLILASPIILGAAIAIKLDSPGPLIFTQRRTGWDGKVFSIWKFRTMYVHQAKEGFVKQATSDDPRITWIGRFLRRSSIDELPQLFNVLLGDMSLVGPRPHATEHDNLYSKKIRTYLARHRIKPGITGLAQVAGFRGETKELSLMEERVKRDIEYINNWSVTLDISILFKTLFTLFGGRAY